MIEAQLELADTLLLVYEEHVLKERQRKSQHQQKTCIEKVNRCKIGLYMICVLAQMIDDYVQDSPQQSLAEGQWNAMARCVIHELAFPSYVDNFRAALQQNRLWQLLHPYTRVNLSNLRHN